ncbi:2-methylcitrate dehydratase PrpD [Raoultella sp. BIGb0138]|uniref:MmgE/PrpD family protein n=1 Tax=Raoultella sp. BIGb0138 TaxID=2485115 RepID=UPI00104F3483|nr:MmgE/PrpD family protein [Raoultella sp. BIGb0138]TCW06451.1 2-methylcitrate dehydratase PrpD [Raoultella sp. BIGb0138]
MNQLTPADASVSERLAHSLARIRYEDIPEKTRDIIVNDLIDCFGLIISGRHAPYVRQLIDSCDRDGECSVPGQTRALDASGAALVNGAAIHGEDFDDTLEGSPLHVGCFAVPAVLATVERFALSGKDLLRGLAVGMETACRLNAVAPGKIHAQGFHPTAVIGPFGAAAGVAAALGLSEQTMSGAFGIAGSLSSGIIEYLAEGAWTKRLHPGWAAQAGYRAARIAQQGFLAPRRVFDGRHSFYHAFAPTAQPDFTHFTEGVGESWRIDNLTFKPFASGTMTHPYMDCMIQLAAEYPDPDEIVDILCETSEGYVHRLWEPLAEKWQPGNGYAAKFSVPWCMAMAYFERDAGLAQFSATLVHDPRIVQLAKKIRYVVDPKNEYPANYTGHIRVTFRNGLVREIRQPYMRGSSRAPLSHDDLVRKFRGNISYGGWSAGMGERLLDFLLEMPSHRDLSGLRAFRL